MTNFKNKSNLLLFPLMKKESYKPVTLQPHQTRLTLTYGTQSRYLAPQTAADLAFVSVQTVYKWIAGTHPMHPGTRLLLHYRALGILPHDAWRDWHLDEGGKLIAPNGYSFHPDEIMNFSYLKQLNGELQATIARLTVENRQLRDAVTYFEARPTLANVVRFPGKPKPQAQKSRELPGL